MTTTIKINSTNSDTKTFDQLLNESFDAPILATVKGDEEISFIVFPSQDSNANTIIYTDIYNTLEACDYENWEDNIFFVKQILDLKLEITA